MLDSERLMTLLDTSDDAAGAMTTSELVLCAQVNAAESERKNLITMVRWMAEDCGYSVSEIADAVEKPWHHMDLLEQAQLRLDVFVMAGNGMSSGNIAVAMAEVAEQP
jgi:hypothetical protein